MRKLIFFSTFALIFTLLGCQQNSEPTKHIYIISTNDIHATIDAVPHLATLVSEYKERGEVILVDSGDRVSGNAYIDDATEPGIPLIELMNDIGYDVATLGNHEFDKGSEVLSAMIDAADFDIVCANVVAKNGATQPLPYTTIEVEGIEISFVGVVDTDNNGYPLGGKSAYTDYEFSTDIDTAYDTCNATAEECDFVVLLSHMGLTNDTRLAERGVKCQWIAGGHSHDLVGEDILNTHISQNNKNLRYVTVADLEIENGTILSVVYTQINTKDITPDSTFVERVETLKASDPKLNTVEGSATAPATKEGVANFTIDALANYPYEDGFKPEVTFYHYGGIRLDGFKEGDIVRAEILNNDPFQSTIYIGTLTREQMRDFILTKYNNGDATNPDKESHYPYFRSDAPYRIILGDTPADNPDALDIVFDLEEGEYRVAMCNYIADNYICSDIVTKQLHPTGVSVREAMLHHIHTFGEEGFTPNNECRQQEVKQ